MRSDGWAVFGALAREFGFLGIMVRSGAAPRIHNVERPVRASSGARALYTGATA